MVGFLPSRTGRFRGQIDSRVLDTHLTRSIDELQQPPPAAAPSPQPAQGKPAMRGLERLSLLAHNAVNDIDRAAGEAADRIEAAVQRANGSVARFHAFAGEIEQKAADVEQALQQLTNAPPTPGSGG
jgi:hypothetical protein